jgi:putative hydrolase of the HAD superfamily
MPTHLLSFDLDDTLWSNKETILYAETVLYQWLEKYYPRITKKYSAADLLQQRHVTIALFPQFSHNLSLLRKITLQRFAKQCDYPLSLADEAFEIFIQARNKVTLYDDVIPVLSFLKKRYKIVALSNGNADIKRIGIHPFFDFSLSAEQAGMAKPDSAIFQKMCQQAQIQAQYCVHIGDHPIEDIVGAKKAGIRAIWLNRQKKCWSHSEILPDHEIATLYELLTLSFSC